MCGELELLAAQTIDAIPGADVLVVLAGLISPAAKLPRMGNNSEFLLTPSCIPLQFACTRN